MQKQEGGKVNKQIHLSIDDVCHFLEDIARKNNNVFLKFLIRCHNKYGMKVTLYVQNWEKFQKLEKNSLIFLSEYAEWLKFGIHTSPNNKTFSNLSFEEGINTWNSFTEQMQHLGISLDALDYFHRLHTFSGSQEGISGMKHAGGKYISGLLTADDDRNSYYFDEETSRLIYKQDIIVYDETVDLFFKSTDFRLDWFTTDFRSANLYQKPIKKTPYEELVFRYSSGLLNQKSVLVIFTHEWQIYNRHFILNNKKKWIEDVGRFALEYGYEFVSFKEIAYSEKMDCVFKTNINKT